MMIKNSRNSLSLILAVPFLWSAECLGQKEKLNVLFIGIDDLRPELNTYGKAHIHSPNMDALAESGVQFQRAYCQQSVCSPSRISLMTGLRPDSSYVYDNNTHHRDANIEVVTLPQHFIANGYHAVNYGKIYHGHMGKFNDTKSWSELAGIPKASHLQGDSFVPLMKNPELEWKTAVFSQFPRTSKDEYRGWDANFMGYSMRTDNFRYTRWIAWKTGETVATELYDHRNRMEETVNVSGDPAYVEIEEKLTNMFNKKLKEAHRQGDERLKYE